MAHIDLEPGEEYTVEVNETHFKGMLITPCNESGQPMRSGEQKYKGLHEVLICWELLSVLTGEDEADA